MLLWVSPARGGGAGFLLPPIGSLAAPESHPLPLQLSAWRGACRQQGPHPGERGPHPMAWGFLAVPSSSRSSRGSGPHAEGLRAGASARA